MNAEWRMPNADCGFASQVSRTRLRNAECGLWNARDLMPSASGLFWRGRR